MRIESLRHFVQVYKERSIVRAAAGAFLTPQGLSKAIHSMEHELGVSLVDYSNNRLSFTAYADYLYERACAVLHEYDITTAHLAEMSGNAMHRIRVGFARPLSTCLGTDFLDDFRGLHPDVVIEVVEMEEARVRDGILDGSLDVAITVIDDSERSLFDAFSLGEFGMMLVCSTRNPISQSPGVRIADLRNQRLILMPDDEYKFTRVIKEKCQTAGLEPEYLVAFEIGGLFDLCWRNKGIGFVPARTVPFIENAPVNPNLEHSLKLIPFDMDDLSLSISLVTPKSERLACSAALLRDHILGRFGEAVESRNLRSAGVSTEF